MGVVIRRIECLSLDSENEKYYKRKVLKGDIVTCFTKDGRNIHGRVEKWDKYFLYLKECNYPNRDVSIPLSSIKSYNLDFRGELSRSLFS